ncbi:MAG TPA: glutamate racemase, partial [Candidatus Berkiella sp.]|nr:glutamate racemase [Candidatus Berkiella sp.]
MMSLSSKKDLPIGIFDSGIGGLTVLKALRQQLPHEHFLYLGDTARLPYGTKSPDTVKNYALNANEILAQQVKMLVIACNTATAVALEALQERFSPIPVVGVIEPGAQAALTEPTQGPVVVLATEGTVKGHAYRQVLARLSPQTQVIEWPCSLLVALAEEGWCHGYLVEEIIAKLLAPLRLQLGEQKPRCVVLGCTHFPVLKEPMQKIWGDVPVLDPAYRVAQEVSLLLKEQDLERQSNEQGTVYFMATDGIERFARVAQIF